MGKYDWKEINDRLIRIIRPTQNAVAFKFIWNEEELRAIPGVKFWKETCSVCKVIGLAACFQQTVGLKAAQIAAQCAGVHGTCESRDDFNTGARFATIYKWHGNHESARAHFDAMQPDLPPMGAIAVIASPIGLGAIEEPDAVILSAEPGGAFYLLAGLVESDFQEIDFKFRGESTCVETWCHTYKTGKPGLTLGCRGDRSNGALAPSEVRFTLKADDLITAIGGAERLTRDNIGYPFYPAGIVDWSGM